MLNYSPRDPVQVVFYMLIKHSCLCFKYYLNLEAQPRVLVADKARTATVLNGLKNDSSSDLTGEKNLEIDEV